MNKNLQVSKRNGRSEALDLDKIHRVVTWAAEGLENVSVSQVELRALGYPRDPDPRRSRSYQ